jgi:hypothetical protein
MGINSKTTQRVEQLLSYVAANPGQGRSEIISGLGFGHSNSTMYRLLAKATDSGLLSRNGNTGEARYHPTAQLRLKHVQDYLAQPVAQRSPVGYRFDWLESYEPNKTQLLPAALLKRLMERCAPGSAPFAQITPTETSKFIAEFCYASSNLEGNVYDYGSTITLTELQLPKEGADIKDTKMILNHRAAIKYAISAVRESGQLELNAFNIRSLHALLSHDLLEPIKLGALRGTVVADPNIKIDGSAYRPSSAPAAIDKAFTDILAKAAAIENPYEASFFLLVHLPYLQPFFDCNKRTSRMACSLPLLNAGIVPISWMGSTTHKAGYTDAVIAVYELNDVNLLANVFVDNFMRSAEIFDVIRRDRKPNEIGARYPEELKTYVRAIVGGSAPEIPQRVPPQAADDFIAFAHDELEAIKVNPMVGLSYGLSPHATSAWVRMQAETNSESDEEREALRERRSA